MEGKTAKRESKSRSHANRSTESNARPVSAEMTTMSTGVDGNANVPVQVHPAMLLNEHIPPAVQAQLREQLGLTKNGETTKKLAGMSPEAKAALAADLQKKMHKALFPTNSKQPPVEEAKNAHGHSHGSHGHSHGGHGHSHNSRQAHSVITFRDLIRTDADDVIEAARSENNRPFIPKSKIMCECPRCSREHPVTFPTVGPVLYVTRRRQHHKRNTLHV